MARPVPGGQGTAAGDGPGCPGTSSVRGGDLAV